MDSTLLRAFLTLMACVAAIGLVLWYVKRKTSRGKVGESELRVQIIARQALSPKANISVVQIGNRTILLGVTDQSVTMLGDIGLEHSPTNIHGSTADMLSPEHRISRAETAAGNGARRSAIQTNDTTSGMPSGLSQLDPIYPAHGSPAVPFRTDITVKGYIKSLFTRSSERA